MVPTAPPSSHDKILDVAEAIFARRGYAGTGLREVADAAGLGKSSLFHHFRSKAELYFDVLVRVLDRIEARLDPVLASSAAPAERLEGCTEALIDSLAEHPTSARLLLRTLFEGDGLEEEPKGQAVDARLAAILGRIEALLRQGVETGAFRPVSVPDTLQTLIGITVYHFASAEVGEGILGGPLFSAESVARRKSEVLALLRHGLTAHGGSS